MTCFELVSRLATGNVTRPYTMMDSRRIAAGLRNEMTIASKLLPHAAAEIERARVASIEAFARTCAFTGHDAIIEKMKADGHSTTGDVALAVIAAEKAARAAAPANRSHAGSGASAPTDRFPDLEAVERSAAADWAGDSKIRAEFQGNKASYVAFRKAAAKSLVSPRHLRRP
jgi:hypothetical protein